MKRFYFYSYIVWALFLCVPATSSLAQQTPAAQSDTQSVEQKLDRMRAAKEQASDPTLDGQGDDLAMYSSTINEEPDPDQTDIYIKPTAENISRLYWALGTLDVKDDQAIAEFLFINDCELYAKYLHNDMEWKKIKDATRKYINRRMSTFSTHFEIMVPLDVGNYDEQRGLFALDHDSVINNVRRMDVSPYHGITVCHKFMASQIAPENFILILVHPFTFKVIPAKPELADLYINSERDRIKGYGVDYFVRKAYLRLKVHMMQHLDNIMYSNRMRGEFVGKLDGYEVYADKEKHKLLYAMDMNEDLHHRRHHKDDAAEATQQAPKSNPGLAYAPVKPKDSTTNDNTSEIDTDQGVTGTMTDPGGMGTSPGDDVTQDTITPGGKPKPSGQQPPGHP